MKKFSLIMIIIASTLVIAGIGMIFISGAFLPWNEHFCKEIQKFYSRDDKELIVQKKIEASAATLKTIDISMINEKIEVVNGGEKKVVITYPENSNFTYEIIQTNDKVLIKKQIKNIFLPFRFRGNHGAYRNRNIVLIKIPDKMKLGALNLDTLNGKIFIESIKAANADLSVTNGNIIVTNCKIDQIIATSTNGSCDSTGCNIKSLDFNTVNGSLSVSNGDINKMRFQTVNGKVKATDLPGKATDYNINCETVNGSVIINDNKVSSRGSYKSITSGNRSIDVDTVNGKIEISTIIK